jgi:hypothetical protein
MSDGNQVLSEVERLQGRMASLPESGAMDEGPLTIKAGSSDKSGKAGSSARTAKSPRSGRSGQAVERGEAIEAADPWKVRELGLEAGYTAALHLEHWDVALAFANELVRARQRRGASELAIAQGSVMSCGPLLRLGHIEEAGALLQSCRSVFELERDFRGLGSVFSGLAEAEAAERRWLEAKRFERIAIGYRYRLGAPDDCAGSHERLAGYLVPLGAEPAVILAHRLAAAAIYAQTRCAHLPAAVRRLAQAGLPAERPSFDAVVGQVEAIDGVRFGALFNTLARADGDADQAIAAVWRQALEAQAEGLVARPDP